MQLQKLRQDRAALVKRSHEINDKYPKGGPRMPEPVLAELEGLLDQIAVIDKEFDREERDLQAASGQLAGGTDGWVDASTGRALVTLRADDDVRSRMRAFGRTTMGERGGDETLGEFLRAAAGMRSDHPAIRASMSEGTDSAGGYTLTPSLVTGILESLMPASAVLQAGAPLVMLPDGAKTFRIARVTSVPTPSWRNEAATIAVADPTFDPFDVTPRSLAVIFKVSRELLADSPNINEALTTIISQGFAKELDRVGLLGSGTAPEPRGVANTSGVGSVTNGTNGAVLSSYANFFSAAQLLLSANASMPSAAIMAPRDYLKLGSLTDSTGQPLTVPAMLADMKLLQTSQLPINITTGTSTDTSKIYVGDFSQMAYYMRERLSVTVLTEAFATTGELGFACHARVDVGVQRPMCFAVISGVR